MHTYTLSELRKKRDELTREMREIHERAGNRDLTRNEGKRWEERCAERDAIEAEIRRIEAIPGEVVTIESTDEIRGAIGADYSVRHAFGNGADYRDAFNVWLRGGQRALDRHDAGVMERSLDTLPPEVRALATSGASGGGYLIPSNVHSRVNEAMRSYSGMREAATILSTDTGSPIAMPVADDTNGAAAILAELEEIPTSTGEFQAVTLRSFTYTSGMVIASIQLLQDAAVNVEAYLSNALGRRVARKLNADFTVGSGDGEPQGLVTGIEEGHEQAGAEVTYADVLALAHSVDPAYRQGAIWMVSDTILHALRGLTDDAGRPLWDPMREGRSDTLLGHPVRLNNDLPEDKPLVFGDVRSAYVIRDAGHPLWLRLEEKFMHRLAVGFAYVGRHDGRVLDPTAAKYMAVDTA
jgi:HK97 family phage major capsid protein